MQASWHLHNVSFKHGVFYFFFSLMYYDKIYRPIFYLSLSLSSAITTLLWNLSSSRKLWSSRRMGDGMIQGKQKITGNVR
ncbi:hypothetical protein B0O99DRAFT_666993 [Bisporella sp. PMI_857]|nr:hypothetical protein B0O99DRAFT_666993 [Bisporella sp. PMI_857]